ncbi:hypothetical protein D9756_001991 [Leucocoprinus leucothites]|uniref:Uncharacterized protein n=1 Tax=Leucocoprinus leucothites TaxID=201217 RepID=A0A8H5CNJ1_9AGAR|nr:hypothetical protein D9756_011502 [Leucoagaricus leucothites]KAF5362241.1 hypothetical protein D9756_001991 [Leucoagaricus leucothites]
MEHADTPYLMSHNPGLVFTTCMASSGPVPIHFHHWRQWNDDAAAGSGLTYSGDSFRLRNGYMFNEARVIRKQALAKQLPL